MFAVAFESNRQPAGGGGAEEAETEAWSESVGRIDQPVHTQTISSGGLPRTGGKGGRCGDLFSHQTNHPTVPNGMGEAWCHRSDCSDAWPTLQSAAAFAELAPTYFVGFDQERKEPKSERERPGVPDLRRHPFWNQKERRQQAELGSILSSFESNPTTPIGTFQQSGSNNDILLSQAGTCQPFPNLRIRWIETGGPNVSNRPAAKSSPHG